MKFKSLLISSKHKLIKVFIRLFKPSQFTDGVYLNKNKQVILYESINDDYFYDGSFVFQKYNSIGLVIYQESNNLWRRYDYNENDQIVLELTYDSYYDKINSLKTDWVGDKKVKQTWDNSYWKVYDDNGNLVLIDSVDNLWEKFEYDEFSNLIFYSNYDGEWTEYRWENKVKVYEKSRHLSDNYHEYYYGQKPCDYDYEITELEYDSKGRLLYKNYLGYRWIKYRYDDDNNLVYEEDSNGNKDCYTL